MRVQIYLPLRSGFFLFLHDPLDDVLGFKQMFIFGLNEISQIASIVFFGAKQLLFILGFRELGFG